MEKIVESFELFGKTYRFETGELAKQATGAVLVTQGDTTVLVTAVISKEEKNYDFFPLTVDFMEKMYSVGRIPGGYLKREARPSEKGTLTARMIDRPIRPGFVDGFKREVHIVATTLVCDGQNPPDCICVGGASAALMLGSAPFDGPAACVRIAHNPETDEFIVNPTYAEQETSDLELTIAGTADYISMVEAGANEVTEDLMLRAMNFGQEAIAEFCRAQQRFLDRCDITPVEWPIHVADPSIDERVNPFFDEMSAALKDADKQARMGKVEELKARIKAEQFSEEELAAWGSDIAAALKALEKHAMRAMVIETGERADGRRPDEIRPLHIVPGYLPRVHGSGLFQRGQTQALSIATLGMLNEWQRLDTIDPAEGKRYMHQYNFPPYCTGETGRMGAPKRREVGHGALAERALLPVIPPRTSSRTPSAWCPRFWSLTALPPWLPPAVPRWRSWMPACRSKLPFPASPWASSRKATTSSSCPTSKALRTSSATWTSRCAARRRASQPCRWTTRPRACPLKSSAAR